MALRNQVSDRDAAYKDPVLGINLRASQEDLTPAESAQMQNCIYQGGIRNRLGSLRITATTLDAAKRIRGGHKFYYGGASPAKKRLVAYGTKISVISDAGAETNLTAGMTSDLDTQFCTWSILDKVYICNGTDVMREYDGTTFATTAGTNIPSPKWIAPILDRLMCITPAGLIERTDPRSATLWSSGSSWATLRPSREGPFTCIHPVNLRESGILNAGLLAFQANAFYLITGTNFGSTPVTAASAPAGENSAIQLLDPSVGTSSPYSVCNIPGVGTAWFTSDLNVYLLPEGSYKGIYIGDKIRSIGGIVPGIETVSSANINQVSMTYFDRYLILSVPMGSDNYCTTQFWFDLYSYVLHPERGPVWYGPMTGQSVARIWVENQQSDFSLVAGESKAANGAFVYYLRSASRFTDAVATADNPVSLLYQTPFSSFGATTRLKYLRSMHFDLQFSTGSPTCNILELDSTLVSGASIAVVSN